jgi:hypothetical protein
MRSLPPFHDTASYVFQRLEPVKEQLAMVQLPPVLDAACKAWYVHRTATALAPHLLELYRRQIEEATPSDHHRAEHGGGPTRLEPHSC